MQRPHLEQKQVLFPEGCSTSSSHGALGAQAVEDQEMLAEQLSCSSASLWNGGVKQWALLGKIPHLHLAMGSAWGFVCY